MSTKPSSFIKYVSVLSSLILLSLFIIKINQNVIELHHHPVAHAISRDAISRDSIKRPETIVPLDRLLDLPKNFQFLKRPRTNCDASTKLIIIVNSKLDHFEERDTIRSTWASSDLQTKFNFRLVFLIGLQENESNFVEWRLEQEHALNDDLVRGNNFIDTYHNLTYKHVMGYKYVLHHCAKVNFIMKADDDAFVNIFEVADLLSLRSDLRDDEMSYEPHDKNYAEIKILNLSHEKPEKKHYPKLINNQKLTRSYYKELMKKIPKTNLNFIACALIKNGTKVRRTGKWKLSYEDYTSEYFPAYCSGIAYFMNLNALRSIYEHVHRMKKILFIDDLFLTGIAVQQIQQQAEERNHQTNYSNYLNDSLGYSTANEDLKTKSEYSGDGGNKDAFLIVNWVEFYNYSLKKFMKALAQRDNSFNSVVFLNHLSGMSNRTKLAEKAWKKMIKNYYHQVP